MRSRQHILCTYYRLKIQLAKCYVCGFLMDYCYAYFQCYKMFFISTAKEQEYKLHQRLSMYFKPWIQRAFFKRTTKSQWQIHCSFFYIHTLQHTVIMNIGHKENSWKTIKVSHEAEKRSQEKKTTSNQKQPKLHKQTIHQKYKKKPTKQSLWLDFSPFFEGLLFFFIIQTIEPQKSQMNCYRKVENFTISPQYQREYV